MTDQRRIVLILGSGPNAPESRDWPRAPFTEIVAINNAWAVRPDWTHSIFPEDFPPERRAPALGRGQSFVEARAFVPALNAHGGVVFAGGTMAFTAGYWALHALRPRIMAFFGCDMVYAPAGRTHFYGVGTADPLRPDVTLQSLEAKSARLALIAGAQGCKCVNLSQRDSRLVFPRARPDGLRALAEAPPLAPSPALRRLRAREEALGYAVPSGRYWDEAGRFDADALAALDDDWLAAYEAATQPRRAAG